MMTHTKQNYLMSGDQDDQYDIDGWIQRMVTINQNEWKKIRPEKDK